RQERSPEQRLDARHVVVAWRNAHPVQEHRSFLTCQRRIPRPLRSYEIEHRLPLLPFHKVFRPDRKGRSIRKLLKNSYDSIGFRIRQRLQQYVIKKAKDGRVGTDSKSERKNR